MPTNSKDLAAYAQNANTVPNDQVIQKELLTTRLNAAKVIGEVNQGLIDVQVKNNKESVFTGDVFAAPSTDLFSARSQS